MGGPLLDGALKTAGILGFRTLTIDADPYAMDFYSMPERPTSAIRRAAPTRYPRSIRTVVLMKETRTPDRAPEVSSNPITSFRARVRSVPGGALGWRIAVTMVGVAIIVSGITLLPLPGPGWLIIFAGLGLLATEYEWASRLLRFARDRVHAWTDWVGRQPRWGQGLVGLLGLAFLVAVGLAVWYFVH